MLNLGHNTGHANQPIGEPAFIPMNPWGRDMPKPSHPDKPDMYQVVVKDARNGNAELRVGPVWEKKCAELLCVAINSQIALGAETRWRDPSIAKFMPDLGRPTFTGV
jgi:hypothetical protein